MSPKFRIAAPALLLLMQCACSKAPPPPPPPRVVVFAGKASEADAARDAAIAAVTRAGADGSFVLERIDDPKQITDASLAGVAAVVLPDGAIGTLDADARLAFERFVETGGGVVAIHRALAAPDDGDSWPWYRRLASGLDVEQLASAPLAIEWSDGGPAADAKAAPLTDAPFIAADLSSRVEVLAKADGRPLSWRQTYDGGRVFATALGAGAATFSDARFATHLREGIRWVLAAPPRRADRSLPQDDRFEIETLVEGLHDPIEIAPLPDGDVLILEREGAFKRFRAREQRIETIRQLEVACRTETEDHSLECGGLGLAIDPKFDENRFIYIYWSPLEPSVNRLSRFKLEEHDIVDRKDLLDVGTDREHKTCHEGGSLAFGPDGCLYMSCGDNTDPFESDGIAPIDEREGRKEFDAQRSSGNSNDLRGGIVRVRPRPDGTIEIPEGNLWKPGTPKTRPEIYAKGCRNPYRIAIDPESGDVWYGDVGPDASGDVDGNPMGFDLLVQVRHAAYFGWPYFRGGRAYRDKDFATGEFGPSFAERQVNDSPNNTGIAELPKPELPVLFFPYSKSDRFPELADGGRNAMAGPVCRQSKLKGSWPPYFDGVLFFYDWIRTHFFVVVLDDQRRFVTMHRFLQNLSVHHPIDVEMGRDGSLYVLDYGTNWWENDDGRLLRVRFGGFDRKPIVRASAEPADGRAPLAVKFSSEGSKDPEWEADAPQDKSKALRFHWNFGDGIESDQPSPSHTFRTTGVYEVLLTATDSGGKSSSATTRVIAGNTSPSARLVVEAPDGCFHWGSDLKYRLEVQDAEDGEGRDRVVHPEEVDRRAEVVAEYFEDGRPDKDAPTEDPLLPGMNPSLFGTRQLKSEGCTACHHPKLASVGPSFQVIASKLAEVPENDRAAERVRLVAKVKAGGSGRYGSVVMTPHAKLSDAVIENMIESIVEFGAKKDVRARGERGVIRMPSRPKNGGVDVGGVFAIRAIYSDRGAPNLPALSASAETVWLEAPSIVIPLESAITTLPATQARIVGRGAKHDGDHVGHWDGSDTKLRWTVDSKAAARWRATLVYAVADSEAGTTFTLSCGTSSVTGAFAVTGGWDKQARLDLGELTIDAGVTTVEIVPDTKVHDSIADVFALDLEMVQDDAGSGGR